ncbi:hypothetical protein QOZ80_1AG0017180 [Eleusine coracana subsp. coracana]|nr:hypothetical protein QOZ80_1AG0017180 [Eleusine coracana subsp. coracana]
MEQKHGSDWKATHPNFDAAVIYDMGRKPHGRLAIGDELINITDKEQIKTRTRRSHPQVSARELQLERENVGLRRDKKRLWLLERAVRAMAAKGGYDFDALLGETAPDSATSESDVGFSSKNERGGQHGSEQVNVDHGCDGNNNDGEDDESERHSLGDEYKDPDHEGDKDYDGEGNVDYDGEGDEYYGNYGLRRDYSNYDDDYDDY